jgi:hypothetical protein
LSVQELCILQLMLGVQDLRPQLSVLLQKIVILSAQSSLLPPREHDQVIEFPESLVIVTLAGHLGERLL